MSEMTKQSGDRINLRATLLTTACGTALLVAACTSDAAMASDNDRPIVWVELGGAFTQLGDGQDAYLPPFTLVTPRLPFITISPVGIERPAPISWDGNAKVTFEPPGMDWTLSAGIVYGRSVRSNTLRQQTAQRTSGEIGYDAYQSTAARNGESHMILDFQAGRDVGLGTFGSNEHSKVSFGVRYAQFNSEINATIHYQPTNTFRNYPEWSGSLAAERKFIGVGPSLSWDVSTGLIGDAAGGGISLDWGVNGAVLFGRQSVRGYRQTNEPAVSYYNSHPLNRDKQVVVPNLGGFAGVSWRYPNAKVSLGYRTDFFFGAIDGGIDTAKKENVGFYGPFASISVGIGG